MAAGFSPGSWRGFEGFEVGRLSFQRYPTQPLSELARLAAADAPVSRLAQVDEMQNRVVALEQNLANAETLASVAMEASAGGFAAEVETRCQEEAIEKELQGLVKDLRAKVEKAAKADGKKKGAAEGAEGDDAAGAGVSLSMRSVEELRGEEILDDVARMEELVNKTICEVGSALVPLCSSNPSCLNAAKRSQRVRVPGRVPLCT